MQAPETSPLPTPEILEPTAAPQAEGVADEGAIAPGEASASEASANETGKPRDKGPHPREVIARLAEAYPLAFFTEGRKVQPLAIGTLQALLSARSPLLEGLNSQAIRRALRYYTGGLAYHRAVLGSTHRIDLNGEAAGEITEEMKTHAQAQIDLIPKPERAPRRREATEGEGETRRPRKPRREGKSDGTAAAAPSGGEVRRKPRRDGEGRGPRRAPHARPKAAGEAPRSPAQHTAPREDKPAEQATAEQLAALAERFAALKGR
ncbi:MAG: ProQ/FINO family protein [Halothiobacillaceae bacterium]|jgi:ProP effector|nr:ProQ/FINO family protein [Halothiobacillaceae bacterium]MDY0050592.1 ProQ/FINO family protein [Halothiobacillaceae bacterium]